MVERATAAEEKRRLILDAAVRVFARSGFHTSRVGDIAEEAGVADRIDFRIGPGLETLAALEGPFDLAFVDADKEGYVDYYEAILPKLAPGGVIAADNTLFGSDADGAIGQAISRFNEHVLHDDRVEAVLLPLREGVTLIRPSSSG